MTDTEMTGQDNLPTAFAAKIHDGIAYRVHLARCTGGVCEGSADARDNEVADGIVSWLRDVGAIAAAHRPARLGGVGNNVELQQVLWRVDTSELADDGVCFAERAGCPQREATISITDWHALGSPDEITVDFRAGRHLDGVLSREGYPVATDG